MRILLFLLMSTGFVQASGEKSGEFDYYVLSLSWSPNWCATQGRADGSPQCTENRDLGWILHGLWPQYENGWPSYCPTSHRNPSRAQTAAMSDIMGTSGLAWHQWNKHGRCSGLSANEYFELSRTAFGDVARPQVFRELQRDVQLPATIIEQAFLQSNPQLSADMITITCKANRIQEARICLSRDLSPRLCGADVIRDCDQKSALFDAIR